MQKYEKSLIDLDMHQPKFASNLTPLQSLSQDSVKLKNALQTLFLCRSNFIAKPRVKVQTAIVQNAGGQFSRGFEYKMHKTIFLLVAW